MKIRIALTFAFLIAVVPFAARGEGPSTEPILRIETGMHTAPIWSIATDSAGRFLVTGSADKTVRVWDLASGDLLRTLRPPIGQGKEGEVSEVAMTPDGALIAASGWTGYEWTGQTSIYLFDRETGKLVRSIGGLPPAPFGRLAFSPDGKRLAVIVNGSNGVQVFRVADGQRVARDSSYHGPSFGLDWDHSGRLVTSSWDGYVRLYNEELKLVAMVKPSGGKALFAVRFSPDGGKVAVGYSDTANIDILSGDNLRSLYRPDTAGTENINFTAVEWSPEGQALNAVGTNPSGKGLIRRWSKDGRGSFRDLPTGTLNSVSAIAALPGGRLVFGATDPAWGVLAPDGSGTLLVKTGALDLRDPGGLSVDATGGRIRFGYQFAGTEGAKDLAVFSVPDRTLGFNPTEGPRLANPRTEAPGLLLSGWKRTFKPTLAGKPLALATLEQSFSLAVSADGRFFLLGTGMNIHSFDASGKELWRIPQSIAWAVNLSGDDRLAVAAFDDGTIRWFRADDGKELLAFFPHADRKRWVAWTPSGYYDASVGGEELIGWHVNRGPDQAADFFPASRFRDRFYRPDVVSRVLDTLDESTALAQANGEAQRKPETTAFTQLLPPVVTILDPTAESEVREASVHFRVTVRSPSGEPVTAVRAYVDGRPAGSARGLVYEPEPQQAAPSAERAFSFAVAVPPRDCTVAIAAETRLATSEPVPVKLHWAVVPPAPTKPTLYLLAVGVGTFANPAVDKLDFSAKDARDVAASWKAQAGGLYRAVEVKVLTDSQATKGEILDGLEWLERQTTEKDVAILYFSGHGLNDPRSGEYLFFPYDGDLKARLKTLLPDREVKSVLYNIPGKVLAFFDTCHSGNLLGTVKSRDATDMTRLINELTSAENGIVAFSASTGRQQAFESPDWKNGAFTRALLEALAGKAEHNHDNSLYVTQLESYLDRRVKELTLGLQTPVSRKPEAISDFPVAVVMVPK